MTTDRVRGFSPLTSHLIGQFHSHLHDADNLPQRPHPWQADAIQQVWIGLLALVRNTHDL
jgi:hypothetical protein